MVIKADSFSKLIVVFSLFSSSPLPLHSKYLYSALCNCLSLHYILATRSSLLRLYTRFPIFSCSSSSSLSSLLSDLHLYPTLPLLSSTYPSTSICTCQLISDSVSMTHAEQSQAYSCSHIFLISWNSAFICFVPACLTFYPVPAFLILLINLLIFFILSSLSASVLSTFAATLSSISATFFAIFQQYLSIELALLFSHVLSASYFLFLENSEMFLLRFPNLWYDIRSSNLNSNWVH